MTWYDENKALAHRIIGNNAKSFKWARQYGLEYEDFFNVGLEAVMRAAPENETHAGVVAKSAMKDELKRVVGRKGSFKATATGSVTQLHSGSAAASADDCAAVSDCAMDAETILSFLPEILREPLVLSADGYSSGEIAERLGIKPGAARDRIRRARAKLRERFPEYANG